MDSLLLRNPSHKDEQRNVQILDAKVLALDEQLGCVVRVRRAGETDAARERAPRNGEYRPDTRC